MSEMLERVALALDQKLGDDLESLPLEMGCGSAVAKEMRDEAIKAAALVAVEALRQSSEGLRNKLEDLLDTHGREQLLEDSWSELIDAVLK